MNDQPFLIYYNQLLNLATANIQKTCSHKGCGLGVEIKKEVVASALYLKWVMCLFINIKLHIIFQSSLLVLRYIRFHDQYLCIKYCISLSPFVFAIYLIQLSIFVYQICPDGHTLYRWCSQPILNRGVHIGDLMLTASTVLSGSNFQKISMFAKFLHLPILSKSTFYKMQRQYVVPSVDEHWINHQNAVLEEFRGVDLVVLGKYKYCFYAFVNYQYFCPDKIEIGQILDSEDATVQQFLCWIVSWLIATFVLLDFCWLELNIIPVRV